MKNIFDSLLIWLQIMRASYVTPYTIREFYRVLSSLEFEEVNTPWNKYIRKIQYEKFLYRVTKAGK